MEKNICYRQRRRKEVVYDDCVLEDSLSQGDWHIEEQEHICRKALQEDLLKYRQKKILEAAQRRTSLKKCRRDLREYNIPLAALLSEDGTRTSSRREMEIITESGEAPPRILPSEVRAAIKSMKPGTASGPDFISADFLRAGGHPLHVILAEHMTSYLQKIRIPDQWKTSRTVLIHKKGDREDLRNYRPICLQSVLYKVFTKIILTRISRTLDEAQPQEQAGLRQGFSCLDHIQTVSRVTAVCREYRLPLVLTLVDYEKVFDSVETNAILSALVDQAGGFTNFCDPQTTDHHNLNKRQPRANLPKDAVLSKEGYSEVIERGVSMTHEIKERYDQDMLMEDFSRTFLLLTTSFFLSSTNEAKTMLNKLNEVGKRIGLRINRKKTQFMKNAYCEDRGPQLEGSQIVETSSYVYLGRSMNMENDLKEELNRRKRATWAAFAAVSEATDQPRDQDLRAHLFGSTVLPALCYAAETWTHTDATSRKLLTTHIALERCLLKFNRRAQHLAGLRSSDLRGMSRLRDPAEYVSKAKHRYAGHIMRRIDERWTKRTLEWIPIDAKRPRGRPPTRWGVCYTGGPAESSAGYGSRTSSPSLTKLENILDDNDEGTKRVEEMLGPARW
ncbi:hypothetical protein RB195_025136 [Necator americanus]|uniref:Reverse transcriptase domain-containing protein n=1 Tax=Necator americanus TaxID=51031 RepID=A0ABR1ER29_NECAM